MRPPFPACVLLAALAATTSVLPAQEPSVPAFPTPDAMLPAISGYVRSVDGHTQSAGVMVRLESQGGSLVAQYWTGNAGNFAFYRIPLGQYELVVNHLGYKPVRMQVYYDPAPVSGIVIYLEPEENNAPPPPGAAVSVRELRVPGKAKKEYEKALEAYSHQQREQCVAHFRKAIEIFPDYDDAYVQLALVYLKQGANEEAKGVAKSAIARYDRNARAYALLGVAYRNQREFPEAEKAFEQSLALEERSWFAQLEFGRTFLRQRKYEEGYRHISRAHELAPGVPSIHVTLYNTLILRLDYPAAMAELNEFLELFPQHRLAAKAREQRKALQETMARRQP